MNLRTIGVTFFQVYELRDSYMRFVRANDDNRAADWEINSATFSRRMVKLVSTMKFLWGEDAAWTRLMPMSPPQYRIRVCKMLDICSARLNTFEQKISLLYYEKCSFI